MAAARFHPSREEFCQAACAGNLIPVFREIMADGDTPVSAYAKLGAGDYSFLLESVVGGEKWAAYSFIGVEARAVIRVHRGRVKVVWHDVDGQGPSREHEWDTDDPTSALAEVMAEWDAGWSVLLTTLASLTESDLLTTVRIRGEENTAMRALLRSYDHSGHHVGQIVMLAKRQRGSRWQTLSIPKRR